MDKLLGKMGQNPTRRRRMGMGGGITSVEMLRLQDLFGMMLVLGLMLTGLDGLRDVRLEGPRYIRSGEDVMLRCHYELEEDALYVVKWYRGSQEFYRFVPKEVPPKKFFLDQGLAFNEAYCNEHDIFLRNVSLQTTGKFKCVVSAEVTFQTFSAVQDLVVVDVEDYIPPYLEVEQESYYPGESVRANCSLRGVSHPPNFTWYVNGKEVPKSMFKDIAVVASPPSSSSSRFISLLSYEMPGTKAPDPNLRLKCKADLFDLYSEVSEEIVIQPVQPRYSPSSNKGRVGGGGEGSSSISSGGRSTVTTRMMGMTATTTRTKLLSLSSLFAWNLIPLLSTSSSLLHNICS